MKLINPLALSLTLLMSTHVMAHGGGSAGIPTLSSEQLMKYWNGQSGTQEALVNGVLLHWKTDACGTLNGEQFDARKCSQATKLEGDKKTE